MAKGFGGRGMPGMGGGMNMNMLKQAQKMQQDMMRMQQELQEKEYEAKAGGGVVSAVVNGKHELKKLTIDPEAVYPSALAADLALSHHNILPLFHGQSEGLWQSLSSFLHPGENAYTQKLSHVCSVDHFCFSSLYFHLFHHVQNSSTLHDLLAFSSFFCLLALKARKSLQYHLLETSHNPR